MKSAVQNHPRLTAIALMVLVALLANRFFALHESSALTASAADPTASRVNVSLPGTIIVTQKGGLYRLSGSNFSALTASGTWSDPAALPGNKGILAVSRGTQWSDIDEVGWDGSVISQLTQNKAPIQNADHISENDWALSPQVGDDGRVYFAYDQPKQGYQVDLSIWSAPLGPISTQTGQQETTPHNYTGGDTNPVPLHDGALLFEKYGLLGDGTHSAQLFWQSGTSDAGHAVTQPTQQCSQPSVSPSLTEVAMVCSPNEGESDVVVAPFSATTGTIGTMQRVVTGCLCAQPVWSPDGSGLIYLAPQGSSQFFQLWWLDRATSAHPPAPVAVTSNLDLDATSPPLWEP